jgi:hypothetical protein
LITAVGEQRLQKGKHVEQGRHDENASIAILNIGRMNDGVEQEAYCIDKNVPLLALDLSATSSLSLLARIVPVRINARPPYMGRLKSSANSWCFLFSCHSYWRLGGDRPTPIDPHESGGGGRSLEQHSDTRWSPLSS